MGIGHIRMLTRPPVVPAHVDQGFFLDLLERQLRGAVAGLMDKQGKSQEP